MFEITPCFTTLFELTHFFVQLLHYISSSYKILFTIKGKEIHGSSYGCIQIFTTVNHPFMNARPVQMVNDLVSSNRSSVESSMNFFQVKECVLGLSVLFHDVVEGMVVPCFRAHMCEILPWYKYSVCDETKVGQYEYINFCVLIKSKSSTKGH